MNVNQYVEMRISELVKFRDYWNKNAEENSGDWPQGLGEEDWYEQEMAFNEMEREQ